MSKWNAVRTWTSRIVLAGLLGSLLLAGVGALWERSEQSAFVESAFVPPGQLVEAGDHQLHVVSRGEGSPGVLLIAGMGESHRSWTELQNRIAKFTRVVSYDRPGLGWSLPRDGPLDVDAAMDDIESLLAAPGLLEGPPILVGHSLGGLYARRLAHRYPSKVSGLVLLDPTPENINDIGPSFARTMMGIDSWTRWFLAQVGCTRWSFYRSSPDLDRNEARSLSAAFASASSAQTTRREFLDSFVGRNDFVSSPGKLGGMPVTVFCATGTVFPPFIDGDSIQAELVASRRLIARDSESGEFIEVATGHYIHDGQPDTVLAAIRDMVGRIRRGGQRIEARDDIR